MRNYEKYKSPTLYYTIVPKVDKDKIIFSARKGVYRSQLDDLDVLESNSFYLIPESHYDLLDLNQDKEEEEIEKIVAPYSPLRKHAQSITEGIVVEERFYYHSSSFF